MPGLSLIVGPPNSGKAGEIRTRATAALARDPVLVTPTLDDAGRFERELCEKAAGGAVLGAAIRTFDRLFEDVAAATGIVLPPSLTAAQRLSLVRRATATARLGLLARSARRPGFVPALADFIDEVQAAGLDAESVTANAADAEPPNAYLRELAALFDGYCRLRDGLGFGDAHLMAQRATAALRAAPEAWGERPVLFYGFDDLTAEQLELVAALADATEVSFAVSFEDRAALAARARLFQQLREIGGEVIAELRPDPAHTESPTLHHLERHFLEHDPPRVEPDRGLAWLEAAGERSQAEQVAAEVAALVAGGADPGEIAVVLRTPDRHGPLYRTVLQSYGIPAAVEARVPLSRTATGRGLIALLRASMPTGSAADLLAFVRTPGVAPHSGADWLERAIMRRRLTTVSAALEAWSGRDLFELERLRSAKGDGDVLRELAGLARRLAQRPGERRAALVSGDRRLELRAGETAAAALEELAELDGIDDAHVEALATLTALELPLWRGPAEGHVRVTSPYRVRARRFQHVFVTSLQEGEFPRHDAGEPLASDQARAALGLPARADADEEERYLFDVCLSRPVRRLYLCHRSCDDEGAELSPSPFLAEVRDLLAPESPPGAEDPLRERVRRRRLGDVVLAPSAAPTTAELARALAAAGADVEGERVRGLDLAPGTAAEIGRRLATARARLGRRAPGPLTVAPVLEALAGRQLFGASTLEEYALCSYRWFVGHELDPQPLDPEPDARAQGSVIHAVLEELYRHPPAPEGLPRPQTLEDWRARAVELVDRKAEELGLGGADAGSVAARARMRALILGMLGREAAAPAAIRPDPELLEASFGEQEGSARPPLDLGGVLLHGKIDRVDVDSTGAALVRDYKVSRTVTSGGKLVEEGKLQLQLYALALERLWGRSPLGAVYQPLAGTTEHRPRGLLLRDSPALEGLDLFANDRIEEAELRAALDAAVARALKIAGDMRQGLITRDPRDDRCPPFCTFQAICRRDRAVRLEPDPVAEEEEEDQ